MGYEAYVTIAIAIIAFILFATEYFSIDHVALSIIAALILTGVLTPEEGVSGFANNATITVASMFVLSDSLLKTGIIESIAPLMMKLMQKGYHLALLSIMTFTGSISAFINNTPVVATLIPIVSNASKKTKNPSSRFLLPISYGAIFGGSCTLIGTSTNLLVSGIAEKNGLEPFSMFLMAPLGIILFGAGIVYILLVGKKLIPAHPEIKNLRDDIHIKNYLTEIKVEKETVEGEEDITIQNIFRKDGLKVSVEQVLRNNRIHKKPSQDFKLQKGDVLLVKGEMDKMKNILQNEALSTTESFSDKKFPGEETKLVEIVILPNSELSDKRLDSLNFFRRYNSNVLAIRQRGRQKFENLGKVYLRAGDVLLIQTNESGYEMLYEAERARQAPFLSMRERGIDQINPWKLVTVAAVITAVIVLATFEIIPIMTGALSAIALLIFLKITTMDQAYRAIDWKVIILLAGALSLGEAINKSGVAGQIAHLLVNNIGSQYGPIALISALYLTTSILTEVMSNNAAVALLAPIAISISSSMGVDPVPLLLAITFAGSASFMTPIGYQTNTMVYSAGNYTFKDFIKVGTPLNILFWIIATFLIPVFYPL